MTESVKTFIEANIELIEDKDWEEVFKQWYIYNQDYYFRSMMDVLEVVEPDIWNVSLKARTTVLYNIAVSIFTNLSSRWKSITLDRIVDELDSWFGFKDEPLIDILNKAATQVGLHKSTNGWYRI